jgi:hypothetical protein
MKGTTIKLLLCLHMAKHVEFFFGYYLHMTTYYPYKHNQAVNTVVFQMQTASLFQVRSRSEVRCVIHIIFR